jgi:hypothetical protein
LELIIIAFCAADFFCVSSTAAHDCDKVSRGYECLMKKEVSDEKVDGFRLIYLFRGKRATSAAKHPCKVRHHSKLLTNITNITTIRTSQPGQQCPSFIGAPR